MAVAENQSENQPNPKQPLQTGVLCPGIGGAYWSGIVVYFGAEYPLKQEIENDASFLYIITDTKKIQDIIEKLEISFNDLDFEKSPQELLKFVYENWNYKLNAVIVAKIIRRFGKFNQPLFEMSNFASIQESECGPLIDYIDDFVDEYVKGVYLAIESNVSESEPSLIKLLNHDKLSTENKALLVHKVETKITELSEIDDRELKLTLLDANKVVPTWENMLMAYEDDEAIPVEVLSFLSRLENAQELSKTKISTAVKGEEAHSNFWIELLLTDGISDESYHLITQSSPHSYNNLTIEALSERKVSSLIHNDVITPTPESFTNLKEHHSSSAILILEKHTEKYLERLDDLTLDADDLTSILRSNSFNDITKSKFLNSMHGDVVTSKDENLTLIAELSFNDRNVTLDNSLKEILLFHNKFTVDCRIQLFNYYGGIPNPEKTEEFINSLGGDYPEINNRSKRARILYNQINEVFLERLKTMGYISSYTNEKTHLRVNHKRNP